MRAYIATNLLGVFAFDGKKKLIDKKLFSKKVETICDNLEKVNAGEIIPDEKEVVRNLTRLGYKEIVWDKKTKEKGTMFVYKSDNLGKKTLQEEFRKLAIELHWVSSQAELNEIISKVNVSITKEKLQETRKDRILMHAIGVLDEIDRVSNVFSERLREWYSLYFPEASKLTGDNENFAEIVSRFGSKENIKNHKLARYVENSSGMHFSEQDIKLNQKCASLVLNMFNTKREITEYIGALAKETMPNMYAVAGPLLASRLLALAGSLEKLSRMPSSTLQVLGAEKALFRHLKGEGKAPKYGIIFSHPYIQKTPKESKGKVARLIAAKLSMAARIDHFSKDNRGEDLKKQLDDQIKKVLVGA